MTRPHIILWRRSTSYREKCSTRSFNAPSRHSRSNNDTRSSLLLDSSCVLCLFFPHPKSHHSLNPSHLPSTPHPDHPHQPHPQIRHPRRRPLPPHPDSRPLHHARHPLRLRGRGAAKRDAESDRAPGDAGDEVSGGELGVNGRGAFCGGWFCVFFIV